LLRPGVAMAERAPYNVLFLCMHNSRRSIMAEVIMDIGGQEVVAAITRGSISTSRAMAWAS